MGIPTWSEFFQGLKASFQALGFKITSFTFLGGGTAATIFYNTGKGPDQSVLVNQGTNYVGVPGPELAAGLPILLAVMAYASYRALRKSRAGANAA